MIEADLSPQQVLDMPLRDAVQLMAMIVWLARLRTEPAFTLEQALGVPLSEAIELMQQAEG